MKSLDPTSVVRESEFNTAASSAGVSDKIGNALQKLQNGKQLSEGQRTAFTALAKKFVENRALSYDRLYDDMVRVTDNSRIDRSYLPTRASSVLKTDTQKSSSAPSQPVSIDYGWNSNMNNNSYVGYASTLYNK